MLDLLDDSLLLFQLCRAGELVNPEKVVTRSPQIPCSCRFFSRVCASTAQGSASAAGRPWLVGRPAAQCDTTGIRAAGWQHVAAWWQHGGSMAGYQGTWYKQALRWLLAVDVAGSSRAVER